MIETMVKWVDSFGFTGWMGFILYWSALIVCAYGYALQTWQNYQKDVKKRDEDRFYHPTDTVGTVVGRVFITVIPVVNIIAAAFDVGPKLSWAFFGWIGKALDVPLVPRKKQPEQ